MVKIRTFVAVRLPETTRELLAGIAKQLADSEADVKWVLAGNFHITLKFLGDVDVDRLDDVYEAGNVAIERTSPFEIVLSGVGAFPKPSRPNIIWVGISSGSTQLLGMAQRMEDSFEHIGFPKEDRPFSPHITIGRTRSSRAVDRLVETIERLRDQHVDSFNAESVVVYKSELRSAGPIYTALKEYPLG
jgi:2'-5' RNA ligase